MNLNHNATILRPIETSTKLAGRAPRKFRAPRKLRLTGLVTIVAAALGVRAFSFYEYSPWTRDGRISAYVIDSAAEVPGRVIEVAVQDNQFVHQGDLLYKIDPRDYEAAVKPHARRPRCRPRATRFTTRQCPAPQNGHGRRHLRRGA